MKLHKYEVSITKEFKKSHPWPLGYFPRILYYLRDAKELQTRVAAYGGEAKITRIPQ